MDGRILARTDAESIDHSPQVADIEIRNFLDRLDGRARIADDRFLMRRLRPWALGGLVLLSAAFAFRGLATWIAGRIAARVRREAARLGARAHVESVRVSLVPPIRLGGLVVEKPGKWEARCEGISVTFRPWGRTGWGAFGLVSLEGVTLTLPAGLELEMNPSVWEVSRSSAELRAPTQGLVLEASAGPAGRVLEVNATGLETDRLGRLRLEGAPAPGPGVVDGEARIENCAEGFEGSWRIAAIGAESTGKATVKGAPADARLDFALDVQPLDLARLFGALGLELPAGAEALGSLRAHVGASGPLAEPSSIVVKQRLEFTPPVRLPAALTVLRGDLPHAVIASDGTPRTIDVSAASPTFIARANVPPLLIETLLLAEDAAFFSHRGLDLSELPKALAANQAKETAVRGASTITQQLAKNLFLSRERTLRRKLQELALAFLLESTLGKDRMLEIYLNVIEWGPGLYGLRPAASHNFGKEPTALTPKEMAFLVALIPGPTRYQRSFEEGALSAGFEPLVTNLLAKLRSAGDLSEDEYAAALVETLAFRRPTPGVPASSTVDVPARLR